MEKNIKKLMGLIEYKNQDIGLFILRLSLALLFIPAGFSKFMGLEQFSMAVFGSILLAIIVAFIELFGGVSLLFGIYTKYFSAMLGAVMVGAILIAHNPLVDPSQMGAAILRIIIIACCLMIFLSGSGKIAYKKD